MYKHLFFDLDHTIWDFDRNSNETLAEMHVLFGMAGKVDLAHFMDTFVKVNVALWEKHNANEIDQQTLRLTRFPLVFEAMGVAMPATSEELSEVYLDLMPRKSHIFPYAIEALEYLKQRYQMHIITNGFPEIQTVKLASAGITDYFDKVVTSAVAGCKKPSRGVFDYTMRLVDALPADCLMIGDNWQADIMGARGAGIDQVYFAPDLACPLPAPDAHTRTYHISSLRELMDIL